MPSAAELRLQIEAALAHKIPSALTPAARIIRPVFPTGIEELDEVLQGGFPVGAVTELVGPECSGRTSVALSFLARITQASKVCAWIDVSNALDPFSAAANGVDLDRLLWVRCGGSLPEKVGQPLAMPKEPSTSLGAEPQRCVPPRSKTFRPDPPPPLPPAPAATPPLKPGARMDQALQSTDLILQGGGFAAIVLDMGSMLPETVLRVPMATWHRYRLAAERTQSSIVLITQHACAKSSAELMLQFLPGKPIADATVFTGMEHRIEVVRKSFGQTPQPATPARKPPQPDNTATWRTRTAWTGPR